MGAGAVAAAGLITLLRTLPTIIRAARRLEDVRAEGAGPIDILSRGGAGFVLTNPALRTDATCRCAGSSRLHRHHRHDVGVADVSS